MLPTCRTEGAGFALPTFDVVPSDVEGLMDVLQEFQLAFHDCFPRSELRAHFFDYMVGQFSMLERKSIEPMALQSEGGNIRGLQRFISDGVWDEEQMVWNYHLLVAFDSSFTRAQVLHHIQDTPRAYVGDLKLHRKVVYAGQAQPL